MSLVCLWSVAQLAANRFLIKQNSCAVKIFCRVTSSFLLEIFWHRHSKFNRFNERWGHPLITMLKTRRSFRQRYSYIHQTLFAYLTSKTNFCGHRVSSSLFCRSQRWILKRTCVFVFVPEQGAALLEDFGAKVTWVDAIFQPSLLHQRGRIGVVLLLGCGDAIGAAVGLLLLLPTEEKEGVKKATTKLLQLIDHWIRAKKSCYKKQAYTGILDSNK